MISLAVLSHGIYSPEALVSTEPSLSSGKLILSASEVAPKCSPHLQAVPVVERDTSRPAKREAFKCSAETI